MVTSFAKLLRQFDSLKIALASLEVFKTLDYFASYMYKKCKDSNMYNGKYKIEKLSGSSIPIVVAADAKQLDQSLRENCNDKQLALGQLLYQCQEAGEQHQIEDNQTNFCQSSDQNEPLLDDKEVDKENEEVHDVIRAEDVLRDW